MDMDGERQIPASRETVWKALNDPEILKQCIPGCEEITKASDTEFSAKVVARVGPVKARFSGKVAQIGSRLIDGTARKLSGQFFDNLTKTLSGETPVAGEDEEEASGPS